MTTERLTDAEIAELKRLHKAATPGPWHFDDGVDVRCDGPYDVPYQEKRDPATVFPPGIECDHCQEDGVFIAAARNALPRLLADLEHYRDEAAQQRTRAEAAESEARALLASWRHEEEND